MGNRRKSEMERRLQTYRNMGKGAQDYLASRPRYGRDGTLKRGEGRQNWPYGPTAKHSHTGVLALLHIRQRSRRDYSRPGFTPCELHPTYTGKGAPRSKAQACTCRSIYEAVRAV